LLVVLVEECSLELPLGEVLEFDEDECSVVVTGAIGGASTTTGGAGATSTGAGYTATAAGGTEVVVSLDLELVVSVV